MLKFQDQSKRWHSSLDSLSFTRRHFLWAGDFKALQSGQSQNWKCNQKWTQSRSMLASENRDFGVTVKLLAETLVVDGTENVDGSYRLIGLWDRWTQVSQKTLKIWHAGVASMLPNVVVGALQTLPSTFIYTVVIHCSLGCSFETFARPNSAEC